MEMAKYLKISFVEIINEAEWLDKTTREEAIQKLEKIKIFISNEKWVENPQEIEKKYKEVSLRIFSKIYVLIYHESCMDTFFQFLYTDILELKTAFDSRSK